MTKSRRLCDRRGGGEDPSVAQQGPEQVGSPADQGKDGLDVCAALAPAQTWVLRSHTCPSSIRTAAADPRNTSLPSLWSATARSAHISISSQASREAGRPPVCSR